MNLKKVSAAIFGFYACSFQVFAGEIAGGGVIHFRGEIVESPKPAEELKYNINKENKVQVFPNQMAKVSVKTLPGNKNLKMVTVTYD